MKNNILDAFQSTYTKHKSTETALTVILIDIYYSPKQSNGIVMVLLDLSSTFDIVDNNIKLQRRYDIGITGISHN